MGRKEDREVVRRFREKHAFRGHGGSEGVGGLRLGVGVGVGVGVWGKE